MREKKKRKMKADGVCRESNEKSTDETKCVGQNGHFRYAPAVTWPSRKWTHHKSRKKQVWKRKIGRIKTRKEKDLDFFAFEMNEDACKRVSTKCRRTKRRTRQAGREEAKETEKWKIIKGVEEVGASRVTRNARERGKEADDRVLTGSYWIGQLVWPKNNMSWTWNRCTVKNNKVCAISSNENASELVLKSARKKTKEKPNKEEEVVVVVVAVAVAVAVGKWEWNYFCERVQIECKKARHETNSSVNTKIKETSERLKWEGWESDEKVTSNSFLAWPTLNSWPTKENESIAFWVRDFSVRGRIRIVRCGSIERWCKKGQSDD